MWFTNQNTTWTWRSHVAYTFPLNKNIDPWWLCIFHVIKKERNRSKTLIFKYKQYKSLFVLTVAGKAIEKLKQYIRNMDIPDQTLSIPMKPYIIGWDQCSFNVLLLNKIYISYCIHLYFILKCIYFLDRMKVQINEFKAVQALVPTTGVTLTIKSAKIQVSGNLVKGLV